MRFFPAGSLCVLLACTPSAPPAARTPPAVTLAGVTLTPPADSAWTRVAADEWHATFAWDGENSSAELGAELVADDSTATDDAFLRAEEGRQNEALRAGGREMVSLHFYGTRMAGATCLQYDGIFLDPAADSARAFRNVRGLVCRHPHAPGRGVRLHLAHDSGERMPGELEAAAAAADAFFRSAVFGAADAEARAG